MSSFLNTSTSYFSSYFSKKDNKYDISVIIISFITFCALSTFCWIIFAVNFTGWFFITVIGGLLTKCRQELFKSLSGKKFEPIKKKDMLDHTLSSRHRINNHFEDFRLSSSLKSSKDILPSIPSYRSSSNKLNNNNNNNNNSNNNNSNNNNNNNNNTTTTTTTTTTTNSKSNNNNKFDSILSFDFSFAGFTGNSKNKSNKKKNIPVLPVSEYSIKRNEKRSKNIKQRHVPDIPSQLGPNRQEEWKSNVNYYPSERHSHLPKSKLSVTEKMIESTAAYRVGKKCNGWINGDSEEYTVRRKDNSIITDCTSYDDPFYSREPIKELNVRLDQERPKITKQERRAYNKSPATSLQYARQYLTILLTVKKEMNL